MDKDEKTCRELLSRNIKHYRGRLGFSQLDLALELGISTTFLSDIETGKKWVSPRTLAHIARILKIEIFELFKPVDDKRNTEANPDIFAEIVKYLDTVDDTLVKHIVHSIEPSIERSVRRSVAKMRKYYEGGGTATGLKEEEGPRRNTT
ncbi:MAG: helix-turn-helix transcriptional regulator [Treponema sp.]|nr:helix-turn-helix transcriptional regulator [Treponema sp.]